MCGIIGILSEKNVAPVLVEGLARLEYRGYDSTWIAVLDQGQVKRCRAQGKLENLQTKLQEHPLSGRVGIGHTRWATHGVPSESNAHPHAGSRVAVVHNGIIENYAPLKEELEAHQVRFESDTDTEVIVHLVEYYLTQGLSPREAANAAFDRLEGAYALVLIFAGEEDLMIGCRQGTPLAVGYGEGEMFVASDSYALAPLTKKICFLEDGDRVSVSHSGANIYVNDNHPVERPIRVTAQSGASSGKGEYKHFMLKEIYEQPAVIGDTLNSYVNPASGRINVPEHIVEALCAAPRLTLVACGTAYYACMVAKYWFEQVARIPCEIDVASEFRYREAPLPERGVAIFISQSGETLDTLEALRYCKSQGQIILSIVNTIESTIERESDLVLHTLAGPEIGVASTKAFTTQITTLACMAFASARAKRVITREQMQEIGEALRHIPALAANILKHDEAIQHIAKDIADARDVLYLGRGNLYPIALEGALKLKEISYIHAEGYAAGEMKHGPIALVNPELVVVALCGNLQTFDKMMSNMMETKARGGQLLAFAPKGKEEVLTITQDVVWIPKTSDLLASILYSVAGQLFAYTIAKLRGTDIDQPRNLAKSVTVE
ncbi:MAG: glutamine--fructose-6-phosphate transaminase (isomerizing) [Chlamydiia bacterium]|nr:glutamine--fructose-6-phosphate transaminase (isomerizing) [Chlamydiia bacterium]